MMVQMDTSHFWFLNGRVFFPSRDVMPEFREIVCTGKVVQFKSMGYAPHKLPQRVKRFVLHVNGSHEKLWKDGDLDEL
ncbi:hypothetical protein L596_009740 [Steinernema carpocapsae]|uniref:Uncharacterized protein n=1 Tax=Steinernema carpocapsae TaxID=34508 RepID=A0A4U5PG79_STECR|nr:hypothetical protein L596_009740 [Steinernema carpocapsae]